MMGNKIKVLIADDLAMQPRFVQLFDPITEIILVGFAISADETIQKAKILQPDILLIDVNLPNADSFAVTEALASELPFTGVILMGPHCAPEDLRRAMLVGAKDYIVKPFPSDELFNAINQVYASTQKRRGDLKTIGDGKVITVFSPRGGVGKTMLAANLGIAMGEETINKIAIVDCNLQFGDIAMLLNLTPKASIADMVTDIEHLDERVLSRYMINYRDNIHILPAPFQPEKAECVTSQHVISILDLLKKNYDYIIVDTAPVLNDMTLTIMDLSDLLLLLSAPDITTTKNIKLSLETLNTLGYDNDRIILILNRANSKSGLKVEEIEESLKRSFAAKLTKDSEMVITSINRGVPFVVSNPNALLSREIFSLAKVILSGNTDELLNKQNDVQSKSLFSSFKSIFTKSASS